MSERRKKKLLDRVRDVIRTKHYCRRTEQAYVGWIRRFILFHDTRHPKEMGATEIEATLTYLAAERNVAGSRQNQALSALLFLYEDVLQKDLERPVDGVRAKKPERLPTALSREEAQPVLAAMSGIYQLIAKLLYGSGLRLVACLRLRVKDIDFKQCQMIVRDGKGAKDRVTVLPDSLVERLQKHLRRVKMIHRRDVDDDSQLNEDLLRFRSVTQCVANVERYPMWRGTVAPIVQVCRAGLLPATLLIVQGARRADRVAVARSGREKRRGSRG